MALFTSNNPSYHSTWELNFISAAKLSHWPRYKQRAQPSVTRLEVWFVKFNPCKIIAHKDVEASWSLQKLPLFTKSQEWALWVSSFRLQWTCLSWEKFFVINSCCTWVSIYLWTPPIILPIGCSTSDFNRVRTNQRYSTSQHHLRHNILPLQAWI